MVSLAVLGLVPLVLVVTSGCAEYAELPEGPPAAAEPWTPADLMDPAELASIIDDPDRENPVILDIGGVGHIMGGRIQGSKVIGPTGESEYLEKLTAAVAEYPGDVDLVIYCGCCPFRDCPNIRPAFRTLREMGLTDLKLLDIEENLRIDWVNRGYPTED